MSVRDDCPEHGRKCEHWLLVKTLADERNALRAEVAALRRELNDARVLHTEQADQLWRDLAEARKRVKELEGLIRQHAGCFTVCERCGHEQSNADDDIVLLAKDTCYCAAGGHDPDCELGLPVGSTKP